MDLSSTVRLLEGWLKQQIKEAQKNREENTPAMSMMFRAIESAHQDTLRELERLIEK